eukprot:CAMPEP_0172513776 /NCGR_PEP_ID=MMETSP1066-20121228/255300_1 /TAXON_ID=671091 /ORGANISM="Coscinodiscus wailesii, Strain CCMP2513" /LENGTH=62 /DNA_ID=CAMNT_0013294185 /DNA_START=58 /DNA_END=242 /DNA_ORIENTATION=+
MAADYSVATRETRKDDDKRDYQEFFMAHVRNWLHQWFDQNGGNNLNAYLRSGVQKQRDVTQA